MKVYFCFFIKKRSYYIFKCSSYFSNYFIQNYSKRINTSRRSRSFFVIIQAPDGSGFEYTKEQSENIEKIFLSELGKGTYREVLTRIPGFGSGPDQVNNGFIIVLLEDWAKRKNLVVKI